MSKILLFTTCYSSSEEKWKNRYLKWFKHHINLNLNYSKLLLIDDGSPILPSWQDVKIYSSFEEEPEEKNILVHFNNNLGRSGVLNYPGWYRSYKFAAKFATKFQYDKIYHIESDSYLLTDNIINYFNNTNKGWITFWCKYHNFPENALQIICKDQIKNFYNFTSLPYEKYKNTVIENIIPYTHIEKEYSGDRYHEYREDIPLTADYACQVQDEYKF